MAIKVTLHSDWGKFLRAFNPRLFKVILAERMMVAMADNCEYLQKTIANRIRRMDYKKNAALTILLKKSSTPLISTADMIKSLGNDIPNPFEAFVGVNKTSGKGHNIAFVVHEGWTIPYTAVIAQWIAKAIAMALKAGGKMPAMKAKSPGYGGVIRIPPRPFIKKVIEDGRIQRRIVERWRKAYIETIDIMSRRIV